MSDNKQKEAMIKKVKQVLVVGACVLFVVLMILSGMSSHWLSIFTVIKPGDAVVVDYTLYDINGNPLLTSNQQTYMRATANSQNIIYSKQLSMTAGQKLTKSIYPVPIYTSSSGWTKEYALFSVEFDAINEALIGMKAGDQKRIRIPNSSMTQVWSATQLTNNGVNIADLDTGDILAMGVSDEPELITTNNTTTYTRVGQVTSKTTESVIVNFGYPSADISIVAINAKS
jgi:FKBP-type peptidyl-prolyl cis-trans isomerase 2